MSSPTDTKHTCIRLPLDPIDPNYSPYTSISLQDPKAQETDTRVSDDWVRYVWTSLVAGLDALVAGDIPLECTTPSMVYRFKALPNVQEIHLMVFDGSYVGGTVITFYDATATVPRKENHVGVLVECSHRYGSRMLCYMLQQICFHIFGEPEPRLHQLFSESDFSCELTDRVCSMWQSDGDTFDRARVQECIDVARDVFSSTNEQLVRMCSSILCKIRNQLHQQDMSLLETFQRMLLEQVLVWFPQEPTIRHCYNNFSIMTHEEILANLCKALDLSSSLLRFEIGAN
jgi:hypothetical protein